MDPVTLGLGAQAVTQGLAGGYALYKGLTQKVDERRDYTADPAIRAMKSEAQLQASGRMANIGAMERGIEQRGAQTQAAYTRAATDASQAFLGTAATGAQQSQAGLNLAQLEAQDQIRRQGRADQATLLASQERQKEIADAQAARQEQIAAKTQLISGGLQGITSAFGGVAAIGQYQQGVETTQQQLQMQRDYYGAMANRGGVGFGGSSAGLPAVFQTNTLGTYNSETGQYE